MNFISRERDPNLVNLQNNVLNQLQNIVDPQKFNTSNLQLSAKSINSIEAESLEAQNAVRAALQEILDYAKNVKPAAGS